MSALDAATRAKLDEMPVTQARCRARGHRWPDLDPSTDTPDEGIAYQYSHTLGLMEQVETCLRCGKMRAKAVLPPGVYPSLYRGLHPTGARWRYVDPSNWKRYANEDDISHEDIVVWLDILMDAKRRRINTPMEAIAQ